MFQMDERRTEISERRARREPNVDMTPMIDCVFLLIVFFMLATTFAPLPGMRVKLPNAGPSVNPSEPLVIRIVNPSAGAAEGVMILNSEIVTMDQAYARLANTTHGRKNMLIIQAERQVMHDQIIRVMDRAKRAGVPKIGFTKDAR